MKRCPTCNKTFTDRNLSFCIDDGTPLITVDVPDEETVVSPSAASRPGSEAPPPYQPPGGYVPPGGPRTKRKMWPWVLGLLALVFLLLAAFIVAAVILIPRIVNRPIPATNANRNANANRTGNYNSNQNSSTDSNANANESFNANETPPPTDEAAVLADLTQLEDEWTVANINADKKKLDRILADDYVGTTLDGQTQGKAEYLRTIQRDTSTSKWEFDNLKVDLNGDRATLTGVVRFEANDETTSFRFVDKFVWRDNRWQATGSEVSPVR